MSTRCDFDGQQFLIQTRARTYRVYPSPTMPGVLFVDMARGNGRPGIETSVMVVDDFGKLVDVFMGAHQRHAFRQNLH